MDKKRIAITGGHATPALAFIELLKKDNWRIYWLGEARAINGKVATTLEYREISKLGIPFYKIIAAKFHRGFVFLTILSFWKFVVGFFQSLWFLFLIRPRVLLSFGSYLSVPVAFAARILGIPIVLHEQTAVSGLANRIISKIAKKVAISFPSSRPCFPKDKVVLTGNLIRKSIFEVAKKRKNKKFGNPPVLYITGGSRGSQAINNAVVQSLSKLLKICKVYQQTGFVDFEKISKVKQGLTSDLSKNYKVAPVYSPKKVERIYSKADLVVSRCGANTVSELAALGIPAVLIPIPWSEANEQAENAKLLGGIGAALILEQNKLTGQSLIRAIKSILGNFDKFQRNAARAKRLVPKNAAKTLLSIIKETARSQ